MKKTRSRKSRDTVPLNNLMRRYQCCGSVMFIPDPGSDFFPSRIRTVSIPDHGSSSKNLSILTPKKAKKWFLSFKKYDPGCSSRIPDPDADFLPSRIPDLGSRGQKSTQSRIRIRNTGRYHKIKNKLS